MTEVVAELRAVWKSFGSGEARVDALRGVDLPIRRGEVTMIEGPSGCGKTTLLQLIGLLLRPDRGEIILRGQECSLLSQRELTAIRRDMVAFIFQDFNLLESLSARQNIALVASLHGRGARLRTISIMDVLGLAPRCHHLPAQLSGGQKQRVAIGRAMASNAPIILADEPTANLDWGMGEQVIRILGDLARKDHRAVVIVSHDARIEPFVDRVISMCDGEIVNREHPADGKVAMQPNQRSSGLGRVLWLANVLLVLSVLFAAGWLLHGTRLGRTALPTTSSQPTKVSEEAEVVAAAPAVVEPPSPLIRLGSDRAGTITVVKVKPGDRVAKGQTVIQLEDSEERAVVRLREAEVVAANSELTDVKAGTRPERIAEMQSRREAIEARIKYADRELIRKRELSKTGNSVGQNELDDAEQAAEVVHAELREIDAQLASARAGATQTEIAKLEAKVAVASSSLEAARISLSRRAITSPVKGRVVYQHMEPGESIVKDSPSPILTLAEDGPLCLRADVDEADVGKISKGQRITAQSDAYPEVVFTGEVVRLEPLMGRRNFRSNRPTEKQDVRIREVLIQLDPTAVELPFDLEVTVRFQKGSSQGGQ